MKFVKIKSITKSKIEDTYDVCMKSPNNNYIANGIVVHNSNLSRKLMKDILPENFEELSAVSSLLRPGPLKMGMHTEFADRKHQRRVEGVDYTIPECIRDILGYTYGVLCYQEQFMLIANKIGGFSRGETNSWRKALVKYSKSAENEAKRYSQIQSYHDKFIENASKPEFLASKDDAEKLWQLIASFSSYGFNRSHSISYTYTSFREYWLKTYYDAEFNVSLLNNTSKGKESHGESVISQYITEILKKGFIITPPNVNKSEAKFSLASDNEIVWGLGWVKNLSEISIEKIMSERINGEYKSVDDFFNRVGLKLLNKRATDALIWSGALDVFNQNRFDLHEYIYTVIKKNKKYEKEIESDKKIVEQEIEYCNISLTELLSFVQIRKEVSQIVSQDISFLYEIDDGGSYTCVCKVDAVLNKKTKTKKDYLQVSLRDETKMTKLFAWPWKCKNVFGIKKGMFIIASIENDGNFKNLMAYTVVDAK